MARASDASPGPIASRPIVAAALGIRAASFLIDREAVMAREDGRQIFMHCEADAGAMRRRCMPST
jgi:hypothetical protein